MDSLKHYHILIFSSSNNVPSFFQPHSIIIYISHLLNLILSYISYHYSLSIIHKSFLTIQFLPYKVLQFV